MKKRVLSAFFILFFFLLSGVGEAFIPKTPHLLHLVMEKIKKPVGIEAYQTKKILNYSGMGKGVVEIEEKLSFLTPGKFRFDIISDTETNFSVESGPRYVKVKEGVTVSKNKSPVDLYTDALLYRDADSLMDQLDIAGIDTSHVSFQRHNDMICYVIGRPKANRKWFAGLWIEKNTLFPIKYMVEKKGWQVEFFYMDWQQVSQTWYPMKVNIFLDNQLFAMIDVKQIGLKSGFPRSLFDIDHIKRLYPEMSSNPFDENARQVEELDKDIENFKKLYE